MARLVPGSVVDRYTIDSLLGSGGMAEVYRVVHRELGTPFALKLLTSNGTTVRERLVQEGRMQAFLSHPNLVSVTDLIRVDDQPALVMEYVDGPTLEALVAEHRLTWDQIDVIARGILAGVAAAHDAGFVHRDLKPANVLLAMSGGRVVPKVADFGIAKVERSDGPTRTQSAMGTPAYMAPEQVQDAKRVDARADVFSLGAMFYELVTGRRAFDGEDLLTTLQQVSACAPPPVLTLAPDAPPRMERAIRGALVRAREARWSDATEMLRVWVDDAPAADPRWPDEVRPRRASLTPMDVATGVTLDFSDDGGDPPATVAGTTHADGGTVVAARSPPPTEPSLPTLEPAPTPSRPNGVLWVVAALAAVALVAALLTTLQPGAGADAPASRAAGAAAPTAPTAPTEPPEPVVAAPPVGSPAAPPMPSAVAPGLPPSARSARVAPAPSQAAGPPGGRVRVSGDVRRVELVDSRGVGHRPGELAPGAYTVRAWIYPDADPVDFGEVVVVEGRTTEIGCDSRAGTCAPR